MKKICKNVLGVLAFFNANISFAVEKFEILPDLPDPLAYAVQPAEAATITETTTNTANLATQTVGAEPSMVSVVFSLLFVVLLIYCTGIIFTKLNKFGFRTMKRQQGEFAKSHVSVVSTTQLGNNKTLHVVELDGKRMLIGASSSAIQLIKDLGSINQDGMEEEYSHIEIPNIKIPKIEIPKIEIPSIGFSKLVTKAHKSMEEIENSNSTSTATLDSSSEESFEEEEPNLANENSDVIIDSLFAQPEVQTTSEPEIEPTKSEHVVDPDEFILYKKYLG